MDFYAWDWIKDAFGYYFKSAFDDVLSGFRCLWWAFLSLVEWVWYVMIKREKGRMMNDEKKWEWLAWVGIIPWAVIWWPFCIYAGKMEDSRIQLIALGIQIGLLSVQIAAAMVWLCKVYLPLKRRP